MAEIWAEKSSEIVSLWDSWGIPMKYNGQWEFAGHGLPEDSLDHLKYCGKNQKPVLHREALKRGVQIINRVMIADLVREAGSSAPSGSEPVTIRFPCSRPGASFWEPA